MADRVEMKVPGIGGTITVVFHEENSAAIFWKYLKDHGIQAKLVEVTETTRE